MILNRDLFVIEISKETNKIKICGYNHADSSHSTIRHYEEIEVDDKKINNLNLEVVRLLNRTNKGTLPGEDILTKLKSTGQSLYDELLTSKIKEQFNSGNVRELILNIDDHIVDIPWELLFDGNTFLCLRFNMGRIVRTRQSLSGVKPRKLSSPLKMLILANPKGDLKSATEEGFGIREKLREVEDSILVFNKSQSIKHSYILEKIRDFDILHYAGHSDYDSQNPDKSGWLLKDENFTAVDIMKMKGSSPMPALVFANSCSSGRTGEWKISDNSLNKVFGLANAFLLTGVQHYIGTFREIRDETGPGFAKAFYTALSTHHSIGESLRLAREALIDDYGEESIIWAGYMLYGDPREYYTLPDNRKADVEKEIKGDSAPIHNQSDLGSLRSGKRGHVSTQAIQKNLISKKIIGSLILTVILAFGGFLLNKSINFKNQDDQTKIEKKPLSVPDLKQDIALRQDDKKGEQQRIDSLIADLEKKAKKNRAASELNASKDGWSSRPLILTLLPPKLQGVNASGIEDILYNKIIHSFSQLKRVTIVDRTVIGKILNELKVGSSDLADPDKALQVGKMAGARFIVTSTLVTIGNESQLNLKIIETETTRLITTTNHNLSGSDVLTELINMVMSDIEIAFAGYFPLRGKVVSVTGNNVITNIGKRSGMEKMVKLSVFQEKEIMDGKGNILGIKKVEIGTLEINKVYERFSVATIIVQNTPFAEGFKVEEIR